ncbi:MBL fold metallo-hydrolase [Glacieibacterium frigidum]|uniref:beta-lactamase n=1 Tax=Glacieibacterium frigidum TaxID=2593303 RepID=A0A552U9Y6_9SPHN|nr:MBL fold metallo-hydrolase [Glacieibacterium frigidum]TRW15033.1 MBL fold metallo-hydrolase [Glacieibacterium frigidum]
MRRLMIAALLIGVPAAAQDYSKVVIKTETLGPGVHVLFGAGGNIGVSTGPDGSVLIDDQFAPLTEKIVAAVKALSPGPVRFVINTHWHGDHSGGNENLGKAGTVIVAHDNVRKRMASEQFIALMKQTVPASPAAALPVVTFDAASSLHLNGEEIRAVHVDPAHTDGDALVVFTKANVIHMGDTYFAGNYPFIDLSSGGSARGLVKAIDRGLALGNATTKYIPGHGPVTDRAALQAYRAMLIDVIARVEKLVKAGRTPDQIVAAKPTADLDGKWGQGFMKPDVFVRIVAESLAAKPHTHAAGGKHH